jgi:hypothetical protein
VKPAVLLSICCVACSPGNQQDVGQASRQTASAAPTADVPGGGGEWYPMGDAAVALPSNCSARCTLDCDVWSGTIECKGAAGDVAVYGGLANMAGMQLDDPRAHVEGRELLAESVALRWGTDAERRFCATVLSSFWNWQLCGSDTPGDRQTILGIPRAFTHGFPKERVITCGNRGC